MSRLFISRGTGPLSGEIMVTAQSIKDAESTMKFKVGYEYAQYLTKPQVIRGMYFTPTVNNPRFCLNGITRHGGSEYSIDIDYHE